MNKPRFFAALALFAVVVVIACKQYAMHGIFTAFAAYIIGNTCIDGLLAERGTGRLFTPTLISPILVGGIADAFRTKVPEIAFFSIDTGMATGMNGEKLFPAPVKWQQEIISQKAIDPTASDFTPGDSFISSATDSTTLAEDIKMTINRAKIVKIKLTAASAAALLANPVFMAALTNSGKALARAVLTDVIGEFTAANFSRELVELVASTDLDTLSNATSSLNSVGAHGPRFLLGGSTFMQNLGGDPRVASGDYRAQRLDGDEFIREYVGLEGFSRAREFPNMPSNTTLLGTFTTVFATNVITVSAAHGLAVGDRVRVTTSAADLPDAMVIDTDYYVLTVPSATTLTVSATVGGSVLNILDDGTGTHSIYAYEGINAVAFAKGALHIAIRPLFSNDELAAQLGIPKTFKTEQGLDPETGLTFTIYLYQDPANGDLYAAVVIFYGVRAGRGLSGNANPASLAAGTAMDYDALRIVQLAKTA